MNYILAGLTVARQRALLERRPGIIALIGEAALRQLSGRPGVVRDQLKALADARDQVAVYLPGLSGGVCLASQQEVASHIAAFERLRGAAHTPAASAQLITKMTKHRGS